MMHLYCQCGYPIDVKAHWEGEDIRVTLHDGSPEDSGKHVLACPQCRQRVRLGELRPRPPRTAHWFLWEDGGDNLSERAV